MHICHITINPIDYERRIQNQAISAAREGNRIWVLAIGRNNETKEEVNEFYSLYRLRTHFHRGGPIKFLFFNIKVVIFLLFKHPDIIHCHDLWVLPAAAFISLLTKCKLVYDAHEYYEGLEIFSQRMVKKKCWMLAEKICISRVAVLLTVSEPIAQLYLNKYRKLRRVEVIRNLPFQESITTKSLPHNWPATDKKVVLYQGHFRPGRGLKYLIEAISLVPQVHLILIGDGELRMEIEELIRKKGLHGKVSLLGYIPTRQLIQTTANADLGVVLFEPTSTNYRLALPNKFFEYIMAGIPVLASEIPTFCEYIERYNMGLTVNPRDVNAIANTIKLMISDEDQLAQWRKNAKQASQVLNWEQEAIKLSCIYESI